ncbi:hypothetical protein NQZ68_032632, partial [Dissostichus eleginoides]
MPKSLETAACQPLKTDERKAVDTRVDSADRNGCIKGKGRKHHSHRRARRITRHVFRKADLVTSLSPAEPIFTFPTSLSHGGWRQMFLEE